MTQQRVSSDVSYILGRVESSLELITKSIAEDRMAEAQYRTFVRDEMMKLQTQIAQLSALLTQAVTDHAHTKSTVAEIKPVIEQLQEAYLMSRGAAKFANVIGKLSHWFVAIVGGAIALVGNHFLHPGNNP